MQESESHEDQYQFEICPVDHSVQTHYQIAISCVFSFSNQFTSCPNRKFKYCVVSGEKWPGSENLQSPWMPRTPKPAKASTSTAEKIQDESIAHKESSSSYQEQVPEMFI